jgi:acyl-CoA dehydrogenase
MDEHRILVAAQAVGIAMGAYDRSLAHVKMRGQFGRKLSEFQVIRHKPADMATKIEALRLLTYEAAFQFQNSRKSSQKQCAMAKLYASKTAVEVCDQAIQCLYI